MSEIEGHVETPSPAATASVESTSPAIQQSMRGGGEATPAVEAPAANAPVAETPAETPTAPEATAPVRSGGVGMRSMQGVNESPPPPEATAKAPANVEVPTQPSKVVAAPAESSAPSAEAMRVASQENVAATGVGDKTTPAVSDASKPPREIHTLDDGTQVAITGDLHRFKDLNKQQGEMDDFQGTCGVCSMRCVANEFGNDYSETDLVNKLKDHQPAPLCAVDPSDPQASGGTDPETRAEFMSTELGIPTTFEEGKNLDDLGNYIDNGQGVILSTNAGFLWDDPDYLAPNPTKSNHAVALIDVARDPTTNEIKGFFINDSGVPDGSGKFVDKSTMEKAWLNIGGRCNVTKLSHRS